MFASEMVLTASMHRGRLPFFENSDDQCEPAPSYASASNENDDQYDQQQNNYNMAARAAFIRCILHDHFPDELAHI